MQRALKRFAKSQDGAVAIEMAIIAPVILYVLLAGTINWGIIFVEQGRLNQATREVVEASLFTPDKDTLGSRLQASIELFGTPLTGTGTYSISVCECRFRTVRAGCSIADQPPLPTFRTRCENSSANDEVWFQIRAGVDFTPVIPFPGIDDKALVSTRVIQAK